jgi:Protein of unknown function (DUF2917)
MLSVNCQVDANQAARAELSALAQRLAASNGFGAAQVAMHEVDRQTRRIEPEVCDMLDERMLREAVPLDRGDLLRVRDGRGALLYVQRGIAWLTQEHDARDVLIGAGDCFRIDRDGLALVQAHHNATITVTAPFGTPRPKTFRQCLEAARPAPHRGHPMARKFSRLVAADASHRPAGVCCPGDDSLVRRTSTSTDRRDFNANANHRA